MTLSEYLSIEKRAGDMVLVSFRNARLGWSGPKFTKPAPNNAHFEGYSKTVFSLIIDDVSGMLEKLLPTVTIVPSTYGVAKINGKVIVTSINHENEIYRIAELMVGFKICTDPELQKLQLWFPYSINKELSLARKYFIDTLVIFNDHKGMVELAVKVFEQHLDNSSFADKNSKMTQVRNLAKSIIAGLPMQT